MNKKIVSLIALLILAVPTLMRGADNGDMSPDEKQHAKELYKRSQERLKKIEETRRKRLNLPPVTNKKATTTKEQIHEKVVGIFERFKKNKENENSCPICMKQMDKNHAVTVHEASTSTINKTIPHKYHAKCLVEFMRSKDPQLFLFDLSGPHVPFAKNDDPQADYDFDTDYNPDAQILVPCLLCAENLQTKMCPIKKSTLHKSYVAHIESLTLSETFFMLDKLPIKYARLTLQNYAKLSPTEKMMLCDPATSRIILQKFAIKISQLPKLNLDTYKEDAIDYINEMLIDHQAAAIDQVLELLTKQPITLEFVNLISKDANLIVREKQKSLFLWALEADCLLAPYIKIDQDLEDPEDLDECAIPTPSEMNKKELNWRKNQARIELAETCFPNFTQYERESYYEQIMEKAQSTEAKTLVYTNLFPLLQNK